MKRYSILPRARRILRRLLRLAQRHRVAWWLWPPLLGMGVRVRSIDLRERCVDVDLPLRLRNRNHLGTHFGGAVAAMCDPFNAWLVGEALGDGSTAAVRSLDIQLKRRTNTTLHARFELGDGQLAEIRAGLEANGAATTRFDDEVTDARGHVIAVVRTVVHVQRAEGDGQVPKPVRLMHGSTSARPVAEPTRLTPTTRRRKGSLARLASGPVVSIGLVEAFCQQSLRPTGEERSIDWEILTDRGLVRCHSSVHDGRWRVRSGRSGGKALRLSLGFEDLMRLASADLTPARALFSRKVRLSGNLAWLPWLARGAYRNARERQRERKAVA
jgi:hypothetical protein